MDRRSSSVAHRGPLQPLGHRVDLLHLGTERAGRLHQGHRDRPLDRTTPGRSAIGRSDPADLHVADGQGLAGGDAREPLEVGADRRQ